MSRHRRPPARRHRRVPRPDASLLVRVLAVLAFVLSAGCAAMGVATASRSPDPCPPSAIAWHADPTPLPAADPVDVTVDRIDACSTVVPVGMDGAADGRRRVAMPSVHAPEQAGWFRAGPTPGERGAAVLVGRADGDGRRGVFAGLADATAGDRVVVRRRDGSTAVFTVTGTVQVSASSATRDLDAGATGAELRLVADGGAGAGEDLIVHARLSGRG